ncbi:MAG: thiamine phosphate synthase [Pyrinomonadaceae bacterium]
MSFELPLIYPITDSNISGLTHAEQTARLINGGAEVVQIREKNLGAGEFCEAATAALVVAREHGVPLIINDRVDITLLVGADGVHLGQDDLPPDAARRLLGPFAVIGYSTHNLEQAVAAAAMPINYLAIGPIFPTGTKANPDPVVGLEGLRAVRRALPQIPLVAIGGITSKNVRSVIQAGADSVAVISALLREPDRIDESMREFKRL